MIEVKNINKYIKKNQILKDINLKVCSGEICAIVGHNGSGKTTLFKVISGLISPDFGDIYIDNIELNDHNKKDYLRKLGVIFSDFGDLHSMTIEELFYDHFYYLGISNNDIRQHIMKFNLNIRLDTKLSELSLGMERRLLLSLMTSHDPSILLLDEPFNGLDIENIDLLKKYLLDFTKRGGLVILSTHSLSDVEDILTTVAVMNKGQLNKKISMHELLKKYNSVKDYYCDIIGVKEGKKYE